MSKGNNLTYTLTLRLLTNDVDEDILNKRFRVACHLYNVGVKEARRRINKLYKDKEYNSIIKSYHKKKEFTLNDEERLKQLRKQYGLYGFACFESYLKIGRYKFANYIDSTSNAVLADNLKKAVDKFLFSNGNKIHYKKAIHSLSAKDNNSGIRYRDGHLVWMGLNIPVRVKEKDAYAKEILRNNPKFCRIKRKWHKHKYYYYIELFYNGIPPMKNRHTIDNKVGVDIGTSTIAAVSNNRVILKQLNDGIEPIDKKIRYLNRKLNRQRRANNPNNYNSNGTFKRKCKWIKSNSQRLTEDKIKSLYQKRSAALNNYHNKLANEIIEMGNQIIIEHMNFTSLRRRTRETKMTREGRCKSKKRYGNTIQLNAPSGLILKIKQRLNYSNGYLIEANTYKTKASKYNHITGEYMPTKLNDRWKKLAPGIEVQRDLYSAYLLSNIKDAHNIDNEICEQNFEKFFAMHNELIDLLIKQKRDGKQYPSCMGI